MSDKDIFDSASTKAPTEGQPTKQGDDTSSSVAILVGEGRKYKTIEDLAKAYLAGDEFIETLKGENSTLRTELAKASTLDEVLKQLKAPASGAGDKPATTTTTVSGLSAKDVAQIVSNEITGRETKAVQAGNLKRADEAMKKLFGDKAKEMFDKEATTPEIRASLIQLASVSPDKFVALFAPVKAAGGQVDSQTSVNTAALNGGGASGRVADEGCKEYYDALRRKEPSKYYSQAVQLKIHQAAVANPNKYFGKTQA